MAALSKLPAEDAATTLHLGICAIKHIFTGAEENWNGVSFGLCSMCAKDCKGMLDIYVYIYIGYLCDSTCSSGALRQIKMQWTQWTDPPWSKAHLGDSWEGIFLDPFEVALFGWRELPLFVLNVQNVQVPCRFVVDLSMEFIASFEWKAHRAAARFSRISRSHADDARPQSVPWKPATMRWWQTGKGTELHEISVDVHI